MTLFIADSNDRVRQRLASIAASVEGVTIVGEAGDVGEAIRGIKRAKPDSVIISLPLAGGSGLEVLSACKSFNPTTVTIMLSLSPCIVCEHKCFDLGADYFFEKSGELKKIVTTLVLLAHKAFQQPSDPEKTSASSVLLQPMYSASIPVSCPRAGSGSMLKDHPCFLAANGIRPFSPAWRPPTS